MVYVLSQKDKKKNEKKSLIVDNKNQWTCKIFYFYVFFSFSFYKPIKFIRKKIVIVLIKKLFTVMFK